MIGKVILFCGVFTSLLLLFIWISRESMIRNVMRRTYESMDVAARKRVLDNRKNLLLLQQQTGLIYRLDRMLIYSGLTRRLTWLTPELWLTGSLAVLAVGYFLTTAATGRVTAGVGAVLGLLLLGHLVLSHLNSRNYRAVNENLLKFLDFLGNYSITAGEVTGILGQISRYLDEPLKTVLDECYYEAQTSGDSSLALLSMAEKIEHPRFREIVRNMEISMRYSADFAVLVKQSRRGVREHLKLRQERKSLIQEALVNMIILAAMSVVILLSVEHLIDAPITTILFHTLPGRIAVAGILLIFGLLYRKIEGIDK